MSAQMNAEMNETDNRHRLERFHAFADAFEAAYVTDDWTVLEPFLTDDVTSELNGTRVHGRDAVLESFREACAMFDRRFDSREMRFVEGPEVRDGVVRIKAVGTYRREGLEPLELIGEEWFHVEGDRIARHVDQVLNGAEAMGYLARHTADL
jgi:SnoaL-like domain